MHKKCELVWGKSPRILPPSPPRISTIFGDFSPKNPQNFGCPRPRPVPEPLERCSPVPVPEIRGFSGFIPKKSPKFQLSPSPPRPRRFSKPVPVPTPSPDFGEIPGDPRGSGGGCPSLVDTIHFFFSFDKIS